MNYLNIAFSRAEDRFSKLDIKFKECTLNTSKKDKMRKIKIILRGTENIIKMFKMSYFENKNKSIPSQPEGKIGLPTANPRGRLRSPS